MGSYAHLFTSDSAIPDYTLEEDCASLQSKYTIPVFWPLLFESADYRYVLPIDKFGPEPDATPTHFFSSELAPAIARFKRRSAKLFEVIPSAWEPLSRQFLDYLNSRPLRHVHMNIEELAAMLDEECFVEHVKLATDGLDRTPFVGPTGFLKKYRAPHLQSGWDAILGLADVEWKKPDRIQDWNLAGAGEGDFAPWDEQ